MRNYLKNIYLCPFMRNNLSLKNSKIEDDSIIIGTLFNSSNSYDIINGIPQFILKETLTEIEKKTMEEYDLQAEQIYDNALEWLFASYYEDEDKVRDKMIDQLGLISSSKILEIGCGTGRDSYRIAKRLGPEGILFMQDISSNMVLKTKKMFNEHYKKKYNLSCELNFFVSNATNLPFPDKYFDAIFHFGGFNTFGDQKATLNEFSRITKVGGKVVFGDESLPPWLEETTYGEIIYTNNAMFKHKIPLSKLPSCAREVTLRWILGGCFYLIDFAVGEGNPPLNLDLMHKGSRGGSMRTRYYGVMEGVQPETKELAKKAAALSGISMHEWLDNTVKEKAMLDINKYNL